ncbi:MAG: ribonuclease III, partial [Clostridia bacterium]|nr:ribonuclease III [Clostridia bacterium]
MNTSYQQKGSLELAYLGDAVYELLVREMIAARPGKPGRMHQTALRYVACHGQAVAVKKIAPILTPEEEDVLRR